MTETWIELDNGERVRTEMTYSNVIKRLCRAGSSMSFVEFENLSGDKEAVSLAHVVKVVEH